MLPSFFIVGAARCGTTALAAYLAQHPQIGFSPVKEPNYFVFEGRDLRRMPGPLDGSKLFRRVYAHSVIERRDYEALFAGFGDRRQRGEGSVRYLYDPQAPARIAAAVPDARIIVLLRHPVERLWSHYQMLRGRYGLEPASIEDALRLEPHRIAAGWDYDWHYTAVSRYHDQLERYISRFGAARVKVCLTTDLRDRPRELLRQLFGFLDVDPDFVAQSIAEDNAGYQPRWAGIEHGLQTLSLATRLLQGPPRRALGQLRRRLQEANRLPAEALSTDLRADLTALFADDIGRCERLLGRRLPWSPACSIERGDSAAAPPTAFSLPLAVSPSAAAP